MTIYIYIYIYIWKVIRRNVDAEQLAGGGGRENHLYQIKLTKTRVSVHKSICVISTIFEFISVIHSYWACGGMKL